MLSVLVTQHTAGEGVSFPVWIAMLGRGWVLLQEALSPKELIEPTSVCGCPEYKRSRAAKGCVTALKYFHLSGSVPKCRPQLP